MEFRNSKGQVIGKLEDGIYIKRASKKKHYMKVFDAWGIDSSVVEKLKGQCIEIRITDTDSHNVWVTPFDVFTMLAFEKNFGFGKQMFLSKENWTVLARNHVVQQRVPTKQETELRTLKLI